MNRIIVCYSFDGEIFFGSKSDYKEIRFEFGDERVKKISEKMCASKKQEVQFEKDCKKKLSATL